MRYTQEAFHQASAQLPQTQTQTNSNNSEFGRYSGGVINISSRSGTNRFHGALYDVERHSKWNANSKTNLLNGDPKPFQDERDWGFAIGGPVGRPRTPG